MYRVIKSKLAVALLVSAAALSFSASAWAFTQETIQPYGNSNSKFADPDNQFTTGQGAHPFGPNGPTLQFGIQQGPTGNFGGNFGRFQGNSGGNGGNSSPLDPYTHPGGKFGE